MTYGREQTALTTEKQSRESLNVTPLNARVLLAGMPKSGKTSLLSAWAPETTLIIDTQHGTDLLPGEHFVEHVSDWLRFEQIVDALVKGDHGYKTVGLDLVDDLWNFVDQHCASRGAVLATATDDYQRSAKNAEGTFRACISRLLSTDLGVWFVSHTKPTEIEKVTRYVPRLDGRVLTYVQGAVQFIFLAETLGPRRQLHTQPTARFEAGSRVPMPDPMDLDARKLYAVMLAGLRAPAASTNGATTTKETA
jgi:hypothetical protein